MEKIFSRWIEELTIHHINEMPFTTIIFKSEFGNSAPVKQIYVYYSDDMKQIWFDCYKAIPQFTIGHGHGVDQWSDIELS